MRKDDWISVKDKMPEIEKRYGHKVLCFWHDMYEGDKRKHKRMNILFYAKGKFYYQFVGNITKPVTHWQPLPPPPTT